MEPSNGNNNDKDTPLESLDELAEEYQKKLDNLEMLEDAGKDSFIEGKEYRKGAKGSNSKRGQGSRGPKIGSKYKRPIVIYGMYTIDEDGKTKIPL